MLKQNSWKKELARDLLALGSIIFYLLVMLRALIGKNGIPHYTILYSLIISAITLFILILFVKDSDAYLARGLILVFFTIQFYNYTYYTIFASLIYLAMIYSSYYLGFKTNSIIKGLISGVVSTALGYYFALLIL
jgi:hypothetical protein